MMRRRPLISARISPKITQKYDGMGTTEITAMTTAPTRPKAKPRAFALALTIDRTTYEVGRLPCQAPIADRAFRLRKADGTLYDVAVTPYGPECDCPDFIFRRDGLDPDGCKHIQALTACGLIEGR